MFLSVVFQVFWSSKLPMEMENLEKRKFIVHIFFLFSSISPHLELKSNPPLTSLPTKRAIFIGATSGDLINLREVLIIHSYFCFTLRTILNSSLGGGGGGGGGGGVGG